MKLNRAKALLLVGTLAAVGCVVKNSDDDGEGGEGGESGESGSAGTSGGYAGSSAGSGATSGKGGSSGTGDGGSKAEGGSGGYAGAVDECGQGGEATECEIGGQPGGGQPGGGQPGAGGWDGGGEGGLGNEGGAPSCDEEALPSVSCEGLSEFTCANDAFIADMCAIPADTLKGYVVDDVRNCMFALSDTELCDDATNVYGCLKSALEASCPDPAASADCDAIADHCDDGTVDECPTYLSAMSIEGRSQMAACIEATPSDQCDLWTCAEGLSYPAVEE